MATVFEECKRLVNAYGHKEKPMKAEMALGYALLLLNLKVESETEEEDRVNATENLGKAVVSQQLAVEYFGLDRDRIQALYYEEFGIKPTEDADRDRLLLRNRANELYQSAVNHDDGGNILARTCGDILMKCIEYVAPDVETVAEKEEMEKAFADARIAFFIISSILWNMDTADIFKAEIKALMDSEKYLISA